MTDTKTSVGSEGGFRFRCGTRRRWRVHAVTRPRHDPVIGISVFIIDVSTHGKIDEEWLHGRNATLYRGRAVLVDNLILEATPVPCQPSASAFRVRMEAIERVRAPGEIGSCRAADHEDLADGRPAWIDVSVTRSASWSAAAREQPPRVLQDRDPTPPPLLLGDGVVHSNHLEESAVREPVFDEQTTMRHKGFAFALRSKTAVAVDAGASNPRTGDTLRIEQTDLPWALGLAPRPLLSDETQILSFDELEAALATPLPVRARVEPPPDAGTAVRTQIMIRARRPP